MAEVTGKRLKIGEFLVEKGLISSSDVESILKYSKHSGLRFGEAGVELGVFTEQDLARVFGPSYQVDFFHLHPEFFPQNTKDLWSLEKALGWGALPLGTKTEYRFFRKHKRLNVGMLDPHQEGAFEEIQLHLKDHFTSFKVFLLLADQFVDVLSQHYGANVEELRKENSGKLSERLLMFLDS